MIMKGKIVIVLGVLAVATTAVLVYGWRKNRVEYWNEVACEAFKEALNEDLKSRSDLSVPFSGGNGLLSVVDTIPRSVFITSKYGKREYKIEPYKHRNNITSDSQRRKLHSVILEKRPLNSDTLNAKWKRRLDEQKVSASTLVRVSVTDLDYHTAVEYSQPYDQEYLRDSLFACYAGYRCEVEIAGFARYTWIGNLSMMDYLKFSVPLLLVLLLCIFDHFFHDKVKKYFIKEAPVIIEKKVPVIVMEEHTPCIYRLEDGTLFDFDYSLLKNGEQHTETLYPQSKILLKAFVEAKDYRLTSDDITVLLWPKGDGTASKVYQSTTRLRISLQRVSNMTLVNEGSVYRLKIAHFIEEN